MDQRTLEFVLQFKNETDAAIRAMAADLNKLTTAVSRNSDETDRNEKVTHRANMGWKTLAATAAGAMAAFGLSQGIQATVRTLADFEQAMSTVKAVTMATQTEMTQMRQIAKDLGATTRFSATDAADGMILLGQAGFTTKEILQSITPTLNLAQAGGLQLAQAAEIAGGTLRGFGLEANEAGRVMDILAKASVVSNANVTDLGEALKYAAPTAKALGLELEETIAIISKLADANIKGGQGGRGFQSLATALVQSKDKIEKIIGPFDAAAEGLNGVIKRLVQAGITTEQVLDIFRAENLDVFTILAGNAVNAAKGTEALRHELKNAAGTAEEIAKIMDDNLNGAILNAQSGIEGFLIAIGEAGVTDVLVGALNQLSGSFSFFTGILEGFAGLMKDTNGELSLFGQIITNAFQFVGVIAAVIAFDLALKGLVAAFGFVTVAATAAWTAALTPIAIIGTGITVVGFAVKILAENFKEVKEFLDGVAKAVGDTVTGLGQMVGIIPSKEFQNFRDDLKDMEDQTVTYTEKVTALTVELGRNAEQAIAQQAEMRKVMQGTINNKRYELAELLKQEQAYQSQLVQVKSPYRMQGGETATITSGPVKELGEVRKKIAELRPEIEGMQKDFEAVNTAFGTEVLAQHYRDQAAARAAVAAKQKVYDDDQTKAIKQQVDGLQAKLRDSQQALAIVGLEGKALEEANLRYEFQEGLRKSGLFTETQINALLAAQLGTINQIATSEAGRKQDAEDKKVLDKINAEKKAYDDLAGSLMVLRNSGTISQTTVDALLGGSDLQQSLRELQSNLGPDQARAAAEAEARVVRDTRLSEAERLGKALQLSDAQVKQMMLDAERIFQDELTTIRADGDRQRADLVRQLQVSPEFDMGVSELERQKRQIDAETQQKLASLELQKNLYLGKEQEYQRLRQAVIDKGNKAKEEADRASFRNGLVQMSSGMDALSGALKDGLGENNAIYKASFVASKAFAVATSIVNIQKAMSDAAAAGPFPANLAAMATVAAETAGIISAITSTKLALKDGGRVRGPGGPRDDRVPAWLSNGEFVVNADATSKFLPMLQAINAGRTPRLADGGLVAQSSAFTADPSLNRGTMGGNNSITFAPVIQQQSTGNAKQDARHAEETSRLVEERFRALLLQEQRVGGLLAGAKK